MKLTPDWRQAWRWWSVRLSALGSLLCAFALASPDTLLAVWQALPADVVALLPERLVAIVPLILFTLTIGARLVQQQPAEVPDDQ
ncbi:DUF7940 domain-containing protein [Sphingomonas sp. Leaf4]|uniref:DUF7940 domain-containing protein n=1 Tax=Sphingomonas sp. Leaf4 TaxID=2876553 RepID=UPI001E4E7C9E|nr:hypothetical protein [Sphingomonas sp. Leaf4]